MCRRGQGRAAPTVRQPKNQVAAEVNRCDVGSAMACTGGRAGVETRRLQRDHSDDSCSRKCCGNQWVTHNRNGLSFFAMQRRGGSDSSFASGSFTGAGSFTGGWVASSALTSGASRGSPTAQCSTADLTQRSPAVSPLPCPWSCVLSGNPRARSRAPAHRWRVASGHAACTSVQNGAR